jgi:preprotein translocase subunit SecE
MAETKSTARDFLSEVGEELKKVTWPDWPQLKNSTGVILVFVLIMAAIIFGMDWVASSALSAFRGIFGA